MTLTPSEVQTFYDQFGKKQDSQSFYEDLALADLLAHTRVAEAEKVFEFGCGTGRFATHLLEEHLPPSATYLGCDLSGTMVRLAAERLTNYGARAQVIQSTETLRIPLQDHSVDRMFSTYVLDLLPETDIGKFFGEAHRVLTPGGTLGLVSLTQGTTFPSRIVSAGWTAIFRLRASLVGGCRPICLEEYINRDCWAIDYRNVSIAFGIPSEVVVLRPMNFT